jgi:hypothetical protein
MNDVYSSARSTPGERIGEVPSMVLRLEADPWGCGKVNPCPKIWGTDDHSQVLVQGKVPTLEEQEQFHRPDEEAVVKYPRASMRTWAATQLAVATDLRLAADRMGYGGPDPRSKIWGIEGDEEWIFLQGKRFAAGQHAEIDLPDDEDVITFPRPALLEWAARQLAEQPL